MQCTAWLQRQHSCCSQPLAPSVVSELLQSLISAAVSEGWVRKRLLRVSAVHGMAGMAAIMASTYKAYLGEGLGPLSWIQKFKIPHPGRVSPRLPAQHLGKP